MLYIYTYSFSIYTETVYKAGLGMFFWTQEVSADFSAQ